MDTTIGTEKIQLDKNGIELMIGDKVRLTFPYQKTVAHVKYDLDKKELILWTKAYTVCHWHNDSIEIIDNIKCLKTRGKN